MIAQLNAGDQTSALQTAQQTEVFLRVRTLPMHASLRTNHMPFDVTKYFFYDLKVDAI